MGPRAWWRRLANLWRGDTLDRGLDVEVRFHLDQQIDKNLRLGLSPEEARRRAYLRFGGVESAKEAARDEFRPVRLQGVWRDIKVGARRLARTPAFAAVAILTIGLGTGAATAVFSVVNGVLLQPLPYPRSDRLVRLYQIDRNGARSISISGPNVTDWQAMTRSFAGIARTTSWGAVPVVGGAEPVMAVTTVVSKEFFDVMGVPPVIGRPFSAEELTVNGPAAAIVSRSLWRRSFESSPEIGGRVLRIGGGQYTVVGVMPDGFDFPGGSAVWLPTEHWAPNLSRTAHNFQVVARINDGVTIDAARTDLSRVSRELKVRHGDATWMSDAAAVPLLEQLTAGSAPALRLLFGAAILLLAIATINVSSLLLARAASRRHEVAVQLAIGAGRARIVRQWLAETLVLCLAGGAVGTIAAIWAVRALVVLGPRTTPRLADAHVDWTALAFAIGVSAATALTLGLLTAIGAPAGRVSAVLSAGPRTGTLGRRGVLARQAMVVVQVALTLVLLAGAGLLAQSFVRLLAVDPGFSLENALVLDLTLADGGQDFRARRVAQLDGLLDRLRVLPGVTSAGATTGFPLGGGNYSNGQYLEMTSANELSTPEDVARLGAGAKARAGTAQYRITSAGYFTAMRIPLLRGRLFDDRDGPEAPHVAVISNAMAEARWPGADPIGRFVQFGNMDGDRRGFQVIGVVGDVRELTLEASPGPILYASYRQRPSAIWRVSLVIRGLSPDVLAPAVRRVVHEVSADLPMQFRTVDQALDATLVSRRFSLLLIAVFGGAALLLAVCGLYALIAYLVAQRTREFGIRMALGATPRHVLDLVVGRGALLAVCGCVAGLAAAVALSRVVQGMLFGTTPTDPAVLGLVAVVTLAASILATLLPARRATRVSPVTALRDA